MDAVLFMMTKHFSKQDSAPVSEVLSEQTLCCVFRWFPEVQTIFYQGNKRKQVPSNQEQEKLESFFNCAATLMTDNLQQLTLLSIDDYTDLLCQPPVS